MDRMSMDGYGLVRGSLLDMRDGAWKKKKKKTATCTVGRYSKAKAKAKAGQGRRAALIIKQGDVEI